MIFPAPKNMENSANPVDRTDGFLGASIEIACTDIKVLYRYQPLRPGLL